MSCSSSEGALSAHADVGALRSNPLLKIKQKYLKWFVDLHEQYYCLTLPNTREHVLYAHQQQGGTHSSFLGSAGANARQSLRASFFSTQSSSSGGNSGGVSNIGGSGTTGTANSNNTSNNASNSSSNNNTAAAAAAASASAIGTPGHPPAGAAQIVALSFPKLIEMLTSPVLENPEIFDLVLYGYHYFTDTKSLLRELMKRFRSAPPPGMSPTEQEHFMRQTIKVVQIRVLIFLQNWMMIYRESVILEHAANEQLFMEALYMIYFTRHKGPWVNLSLNKLLASLEEVYKYRDAVDNERAARVCAQHALRVESLVADFLLRARRLVKHHHSEIASQLCLFDQDVFCKIDLAELIKPPPAGAHSYLRVQSRMFNALGFLVKFFYTVDARAHKRLKYLQVMIDLAYDLFQFNNFNSAYAVYLGVKTVLVDAQAPPAVSWAHDKKLKKMEKKFDDQAELLQTQNSAMYPCVPFLGVYRREIIYACDSTSHLDVGGLVNIRKLERIVQILKKVDNFREQRYTFRKMFDLYSYIEHLQSFRMQE